MPLRWTPSLQRHSALPSPDFAAPYSSFPHLNHPLELALPGSSGSPDSPSDAFDPPLQGSEWIHPPDIVRRRPGKKVVGRRSTSLVHVGAQRISRDSAGLTKHHVEVELELADRPMSQTSGGRKHQFQRTFHDGSSAEGLQSFRRLQRNKQQLSERRISVEMPGMRVLKEKEIATNREARYVMV